MKKLLGTETGRRVFGYQIQPIFHIKMKLLADKLHVPLFALVEHIFEISAIVIEDIFTDSEESNSLQEHIEDIHVKQRTIEKIHKFDEEMATSLAQEIQKQSIEDKVLRTIIKDYIRNGIRARQIPGFIRFGMMCRIAISRGWPDPTGYLERRSNYKNTYYHKDKPLEDKKNQYEIQDESSGQPE